MVVSIVFQRCSLCNIEKDISSFDKRTFNTYRKDCKACRNKRIKRWYYERGGYLKVIANQKKYWATQKGKESQRRGRLRYLQTEKGQLYKRKKEQRYRAKEENRIKRRAYLKVWKSQYLRGNGRLPNLAHCAVRKAIKKGILPRLETILCKKCPDTAKEYHHFLGYKKENRLDVIPLCRSCHIAVHRPLGTATPKLL